MAVIQTVPVDGTSQRNFTMDAGTIIGVRLAKVIPAGDFEGITTPQGDVRVRPTNVTATVSTAAGIDPDYILLNNGPQGGFTQQFKPTAGGADFRTNAVVTAVITTV